MMDMIKEAVDTARVAQRNYNLDKEIPMKDLDTLVYAARNGPKKAMENHFALHVYTDKDLIKQIYDETKMFLVPPDECKTFNDLPDDMFEMRDGRPWQNDDKYAVKNSQVMANAIFVFSKVENEGEARGGTHQMAHDEEPGSALTTWEEQKAFSIGIAVGNLTLSAAMLGYKCGICSAFSQDNIGDMLLGHKTEAGEPNPMEPKLIIGVGYANEGVPRRQHHETVNSELPYLKPQNGRNPDEKFMFPKLTGETDLYINGEKQK